MKTVAIIQARLGSKRLPGKVLRELAGRPMIHWVVDRISKCKTVDAVVVATTRHEHDDRLVGYCNELGWNVVRGSENDVLSRYVLAAEKYEAGRIVRITADCPLIDPEIVDQVVNKLAEDNRNDYASNFFPKRFFPRGLDAEAFTMAALEKVDQLSIEAKFREHVTLKIYSQPEGFRITSVCNSKDQSNLRWTVDCLEDFELVSKIVNHMDRGDFSFQDVIAAYEDHPEWHLINQNTKQKAA